VRSHPCGRLGRTWGHEDLLEATLWQSEGVTGVLRAC
jgi:hypothetical protein